MMMGINEDSKSRSARAKASGDKRFEQTLLPLQGTP